MLKTLLIPLCCLCLCLPILAQDNDVPVPDLTGLTAPEAEAQLNALGLRLDPLIAFTDEGRGEIDRIIEQSVAADDTADSGDIITVTILREYNVELIWDNSDFLEDTPSIRSVDGDDVFTLHNLSDETLNLNGIQIGNFEARNWGDTLRPEQCVQIWSFNEENALQIPECDVVQGGSGVLSRPNAADQFWIGDGFFDVTQNGVHRGRCEHADGRCRVWVSLTEDAEDTAPYIYMLYDAQQLMIVNNSQSQWMDVSRVELANLTSLTDESLWDTIIIPDLERLAPNQCLWFTEDVTLTALVECDVIATQETSTPAIFWDESFIVTFAEAADDETNQCPAASDTETICLLER